MNVWWNFRWLVVAVIGCLCALAWSLVAIGLFVKFTVPVWTGIVVTAAVSTEVLFWTLAAALGVSVIQARHRLLARARSLFRRIK
jgi:hypothetical protein